MLSQLMPLHWGEVSLEITVKGDAARGERGPREGSGGFPARSGSGGLSTAKGRARARGVSGAGGASSVSGRGGNR